MEIELVPKPDADDPALRAAVAGIEQTGLADEVRPPACVSAWRRAGLREAVDRNVTASERGTAVTEGTPQRGGGRG